MAVADELEHVDVLIVGAGLSGVGAGYHLQVSCPGKTYAILEARDCIGGTWDLFRYPGIRADSDMYTLGYAFRPWTEASALADGHSILSYVRATAGEHGIDRHVRYRHRVVRAEFSTAEARWTVEAERGEERESVQLTCGFLFMCGGYYRYDEGYTPDFAGTERFAGRVVHPQHWSDDVDYAGKRVVVIGSGATAVTLVPALAERAAHVTMLQRSPSYVVSLATEDPLAAALERMVPARIAYPILRWKSILLTMLSFQLSRRWPGIVKAVLKRALARQLPSGFDLDTHFSPTYNPWDQRLCVVPGGDLFRAIRTGRASIVTDEIATFTERGIELRSGAELEADLVVTATGLRLLAFGGVHFVVDGRGVELPETMSYRGMMRSGVPNFAVAVGYTNASWTLKCDLTCAYVCRLLNHMEARGYRQCVPRRDPSVAERPFLDFSSGYVLRSLHELPKQGSEAPWRLYQNYPRDIVSLRFGRLEDGVLEFSGATSRRIPSPSRRASSGPRTSRRRRRRHGRRKAGGARHRRWRARSRP